MKDSFYMACFRDNVGGNVAFHGLHGNGYVTDVRLAMVYTREEAQKAWNGGRSYDQPISAEHVKSLLVMKVDCQYIPTRTEYDPTVDTWLAFKKGSWSGNDVYWRTPTGTSLDVMLAMPIPLCDVNSDDESTVFVPYDVVMAKKRPTFAMRHFNPRSMVQGAGLKKPEHMKLASRRKSNPKSRFNCPYCGKLHWQYNPHDFEGCNDRDCKGYVSFSPSYY